MHCFERFFKRNYFLVFPLHHFCLALDLVLPLFQQKNNPVQFWESFLVVERHFLQFGQFWVFLIGIFLDFLDFNWKFLVFFAFQLEFLADLSNLFVAILNFIFKFGNLNLFRFVHFGESVVFLGEKGNFFFILIDLALHFVQLFFFSFKFKFALFEFGLLFEIHLFEVFYHFLHFFFLYFEAVEKFFGLTWKMALGLIWHDFLDSFKFFGFALV
jgi:hypothetical protein